jgi:hypothetical protein
MAYKLYKYLCEVEVLGMDKTKAKILVSILMDSALYHTMSHQEKISLLSRLERDYPSLFTERNEDEENEKAV